MKRLKKNQLHYWCDYCTPKTVKATHRMTYGFDKFCCFAHIENLKEDEKLRDEMESHLTEADYQTWYRL